MDTTPYILKEFKAFNLDTEISEIKAFFSETTFSHFPVVDKKTVIGLISETDVNSLEDNSKNIGDFRYLLSLFFTEEINNFIEFFRIFSTNDSNIIPVVNSKKEYIGYYDLIDVLHFFNDATFFKHEGIVVLLEKESSAYSFSEISQIIESNKGKVLGIFLSENTGSTVKVSVKFDAPDFNDIIQSFRRYEYTILSNHEEDFYLEDLKERSNYLQKYLNI
jgi:hypothetical protein